MSTDDFFKQQTPSSRIKANIVAQYFPKYCKIINTKGQKRIAYVDLYAGPGKYEDGNPSTPLLIAKACHDDAELRGIVKFAFNDNKYIEQLKSNLFELYPEGSFTHEPRFAAKTVGDDKDITDYLMKERGAPNLTPTLLFVDPFGYKSINTLALANFMNGWGNEIFLFLNVKRIQAALDNDKFDELMTSLFPTSVDKLREDRRYKAHVRERLNLIVTNLFNEFKTATKTGELFHCRFKFMEEDVEGTSHYIIHFTKHKRGYDLVKQIYYEFDNIGACLDGEGNYTFDAKRLDIPEGSTFNFGDENVAALSAILEEKYKGKAIKARQLFEEHQVTTQFAGPHYIKALRHMVDSGKVTATFTDGVDHRVNVLLTNHCELFFNN